MSSSVAMPAVAEVANKAIETKDQTVSAEIAAFARLIDPFAEGTKFTPINGTATTETNSTAEEHDAGAIDEAASSGDKQDVAEATAPKVKETTKEAKKDVIKATIKKRGVPQNDDEAPAPKKKRGAAKVKKETTDDKGDEGAAEADIPPTPPVTPKKGRGGKAAKTNNADVEGSAPVPKSSKKSKAVESSEESVEPPTSQESASTTKNGTPRKRAAAGKEKAVARGLPTSIEEASEADKMLIHMKDVENKSWSDIRSFWMAMTGQETASSTLPNRYNRLKAVFMVLKEGDAPRLVAAKNEVEAEFKDYIAKFNADKWGKIQKLMEVKGTTEKYPTLFLQKEYEKVKAADDKGKEKDAEMGDANGNDNGSAEAEDGHGSGKEDGIKAEAEE